MTDYRDLSAWKQARVLVQRIYQMTANFPPSEQYGLTLRMRRVSVNIVSHIAEGFGRQSAAARLRSLDFARGATFELETQLVLAGDLGFAYVVEAEVNCVRELICDIDGLIEHESARS